MSTKTVHLKSRAIQCRADELGATDYIIERRGGITYVVTAHSQQDAEDAVTYLPAPKPDDSQETLLPGIPPSE